MLTRLLFHPTRETGWLAEVSMTALRVFSGLSLALAHGISKVPPQAKFVEGVGALGFPMPVLFAWGAGLAELLGGLFLAFGLCTRPAAFFIAFTMAVAAFGRHAADPFKIKELALVYLAIAIVFTVRGAGSYSIDNLISRSLHGKRGK